MAAVVDRLPPRPPPPQPAAPGAAADPAAASPLGGRLRCVDVLRGLAVLGMILVNNQGSGAHAFWGLAHADWNGWSVADLVFPTFLFVVGASMALSMAKRPMPVAKAVRRAVLLFAIGFTLNALPPTVLAEVRIMGVLQRIGLAFLLAYLLVRTVPARRQVVIAGAALLGYWALVAHWPMVPEHSLPGMVDRFLLGVRHVYKNGGYDPEGLLSTIPATVSVLSGYWALTWLRRQRVGADTARRLAVTGLAVAAVGQLWNVVFPINKRLWTSSFVLLTSGLAVVLLAVTYWWTEVRAARTDRAAGRASRGLEIFGMNALIVFAGSEILTGQLKAHGVRVWLYDHVYSPVFGFTLASLVYGTAICALWFAVAWLMYRRRIFVKV